MDVRSEQAHQEQPKVIRSTIKQWQEKYPKDNWIKIYDYNLNEHNKLIADLKIRLSLIINMNIIIQ